MARAHYVKKARKANKAAGIKKGQPYWWWKFRRGGKHYSLTPPLASQLTQSEFWSAIYSLQERDQPADLDDIETEVDDIKSELDNIRQECEDKLSNMPEGLQQGATGQMLQERADACDNAISELDSLDINFEPPEKDEDTSDEDRDKEVADAKDSRLTEIWDEVMEHLGGISCE